MRYLLIIRDILLAPFVALMNPWSAMHGRVGAGLSSLSVAGMAAWFTFFFLIIITVVFFVAHFVIRGGYTPEWLQRLLYIIPLIIVIPVVVYYTVRFWMQEAGERFDDIEKAWREGLAELGRCGFDLQQLPLYLVIGSESSMKDEYLFAATQLTFVIKRFPKGRGIPLRWYVGEDAAFVVLSRVGCLTDLARSAQGAVAAEKAQVPLEGPALFAQPTCWPTEDETSISLDDSVRIPSQQRGPTTDVLGGMTIDPGQDTASMPAGIGPAPGKKSLPTLRPLSREEIDLERRRLAFLCRLISEARRPLCPINGLVVEIPLNLIVSDNDSKGMIICNALQTDVSILVSRFALRFPVYALVTGWHEDLGFQEFMRRMGPEKTSNNRFGKGFGIGDPPLTDQLEALCKQSCGAFEGFIYKLFKETEALSKPGNRALYTLLCKVRRYLLPRLDKVVADGLGCKTVEAQFERPFVAGCYHVAAGPHEDLRAFVGPVFQGSPNTRPLLQVHEELEWTPAQERRNRLFYTFGFAFLLVSVALIAASIAVPIFAAKQG